MKVERELIVRLTEKESNELFQVLQMLDMSAFSTNYQKILSELDDLLLEFV